MQQIAEAYGIPMLIVTSGANGSVDISAGRFRLAEVLAWVVKQNPEYRWEAHDSVIYFHNRRLDKDPENFLNWGVDTFTIFDDVADVDLSLRAHLQKLRYHVKGKGGLITGIRDSELAKHSLPTLTLHNVTAAEVVLKVLALDRNFYSAIEFPRAEHLADHDLDEAFISWRWIPLTPKQDH